MWGYFFTDRPVRSWDDAKQQNDAAWQRFIRTMYRSGIYLAPSPYEAAFWSTVHSQADIKKTLTAADEAFSAAR